MKIRWLVLIGLLAFSLCLPGVNPAGAELNAPKVGPPQVPGEVLVKFKASMGASLGPIKGKHLASLVAGLPAEAQAALQDVQGTALRAFPRIRMLQVKIPADLPVPQAVATLNANGAVENAEPNHMIFTSQVAPNDGSFPLQWALNNTGQTGGVLNADISAPEAWTVQRDGSATIVAVIDTGVDYNHPDLIPSMWKNFRDIKNNGVDEDQNGWVDDFYGIDAFHNTGKPWDDNGHGTHVAGIIGAAGNNTAGVCGVTWKTRIMSLKFLDNTGSGSVADAITCIKYALSIKTREGYPRMVINASWTVPEFSQALFDAINTARTAGVLFVTAAGNAGANNDVTPVYPANFALDNIVSVGASTNKDLRPSWSNYGFNTVHLFAPGSSILSTYKKNYALLSGTSMSCAHVSGAAALVWTKNPALLWNSVKALILNGVDLKNSFFQRCKTGGRLNLQKPVVNAGP